MASDWQQQVIVPVTEITQRAIKSVFSVDPTFLLL